MIGRCLDSGRLGLEGKVIQRIECRPHADKNYMLYKKHQVEESNKPDRYVIQIDKPVNTYKPVSTHAHIVSTYIYTSSFEMNFFLSLVSWH